MAPRKVRSSPLNMRGSVNAPRVPQCGQAMSFRPFSGGWPCFSSYPSIRWSARKRRWHDWHSVSGSTNSVTWPLASHTSRARMTEESSPTMSSRSWTIAFHHCRLMLFFISTPSGP